MFSSLALDERTMKFCEKTSETLRNALDIFFERRIARWLCSAAVGAEDAALLSSLRGRSVPISSGRTEPSFCGRIGGHRSCGFVQVKRVSELDRLLQRNQSGGFASGTQLYDYLKAHKCVGLTAGRARVYSTRGQYVCIYDPKDNKMSIYPRAWTRREMLSK